LRDTTPCQIFSASLDANPIIMPHYNAARYSLQLKAKALSPAPNHTAEG
jgi:hypothetical protein